MHLQIFEKQIEIRLFHPASTLESRIQVILKIDFSSGRNNRSHLSRQALDKSSSA
ncbi:MAG: hypothetical protein P8X89_19500 [Reinekea sp.]